MSILISGRLMVSEGSLSHHRRQRPTVTFSCAPPRGEEEGGEMGRESGCRVSVCVFALGGGSRFVILS